MATLEDLYAARRAVMLSRQSQHEPSYTQLEKFLLSLKRTQPYDIVDYDTRRRFEAVPFFGSAPFGRPATVPGRDDYIYRICNMKDVVKGSDWFDDKGSDAGNWNHIQQKGKGGWTRLNRLAAGTYKCRPRRFSWWTSYPLFQDVISGAHCVGMTNDWVPFQCVVLRCRIDYVNRNKLALVPSVIDAFMQLIFHPTRDVSFPPYGITIDLSLFPRTLSPGIDEVVLPEISVAEIEVLPINADRDYRDGKNEVCSDFPLLSALLEYYYQNL
jgi:hypothetical protein